MAVKTLKERLLEKAHKAADGCWLWTAAFANFGYGKIAIGNYRWDRAHRVSWRIFHGEIPKGMCVLHKCDTPPCINPDHLYLGTKKQNASDKVSRGRHPTKLSKEQIPFILADPRSMQKIADDYGVCSSNIWLIKHRHTWKLI